MSDMDDFLPICVPENAAEIRAMYRRQRERIEELEAENKVLLSSDRVKELETELATLREALERIANRQGYWTPDVAVAKAALDTKGENTLHTQQL